MITISGLEPGSMQLIVCSLGKKPRSGGIPARERRRSVMIVFDRGDIFAKFV